MRYRLTVHFVRWTRFDPPRAKLAFSDLGTAFYRFGRYRLGAGKTVTVHTGRGSSSARHRYWQQDWYVWNNDGDRARLKKPNGTTADRCSYSGAGSSVTC